jgi:DNA polymerase delta subunit 1
MPGSQEGPVPIMRMYGVTVEGNSVCCHVHGFSPYFFVSAPSSFTDQDCHAFKVRVVFLMNNFQHVPNRDFFLHFLLKVCKNIVMAVK